MAVFLALALALMPAGATPNKLPTLPTQYVVESWGVKTGLPEETVHAVTRH